MTVTNINAAKDILGLIREKRDNSLKLLQEFANIYGQD